MHAAEVQEGIRLLEEELHKAANEVALPYDQALELLYLHDESRFCMDHGDLRKARKILEKLLARFPNFIPAWNNLCQIHEVLGEADQAAAATQRALEIEPTNIYALSNRAAQLFLSGHPEDAAACVAHLKAYAGGVVDRWPKMPRRFPFWATMRGSGALFEG
jgi:tetratricopeptide (TPR) repeat protein